MKFRVVVIAIASCSAVSCGGPRAPQFDDLLVERFDVPECSDVQPVRMAGLAVDEGHMVAREYRADLDCIKALERWIAEMDFKQESRGIFVAHRDRDWTEILKFGPSQSVIDADPEFAARVNLRWEQINP